MKKAITFVVLSLLLGSCSTVAIPTPQIIVVTVVVQPTLPLATNTPIPTIEFTPTVTPNPCLLWSEVTLAMAGQKICVRGIIRKIDPGRNLNRWDFSEDHKGFLQLRNI